MSNLSKICIEDKFISSVSKQKDDYGNQNNVGEI